MCWKFVLQYAIFLLNPVDIRIPTFSDIATKHLITTSESDVTYFQHIHLSGQANSISFFFIKVSSFIPLCFLTMLKSWFQTVITPPPPYQMKMAQVYTVHILHMSHYCKKCSFLLVCLVKTKQTSLDMFCCVGSLSCPYSFFWGGGRMLSNIF